jgi:hypothetical protein
MNMDESVHVRSQLGSGHKRKPTRGVFLRACKSKGRIFKFSWLCRTFETTLMRICMLHVGQIMYGVAYGRITTKW